MSMGTAEARPARPRIARVSAWRRAAHFTSRNKLFVLGAVLFGLIVVSSIFAPLIAPYSPTKVAMGDKLLPPSFDHWMGTDNFGRDVFSRVLYGGQISLTVGFVATLLAIIIGTPIGLVAGYFGGRIDAVLMRISDVFLAFPPLLLPIAITGALGPGLTNAMIAIAVSWFPWYARLMRAAAISVKNEVYISAARAVGVGHGTIILRHVLPNSTTPLIVQGSMDFGYTILAAASLSFIGLGARAPDIEWGLMAAASRAQFLDHWWTAFFPGFAILVTVLAVNLIGDGLRDVLDPKHGTRQ